MPSFTETKLWQDSLANKSGQDPAANARNHLRDAYFKFRERAGLIAGEIAHDLPEFTVHDLTHLDALWEMADLIAGPNIHLTPTEAFVLGGAFLIHDLGNGLAAYPDGIDSLRSNPAWFDIIAALLVNKLGRTPSMNELENVDKEIERQATGELLRNLHAKHAERLGLISWKDRQKDNVYYLIEDSDLRQRYGPIIGKIAHSHWWEVDRLGQEFTVQIGAPPAGYPREWAVDPLKIACLLRVADASHVDARRAPGFLRALRKPSDFARQHWVFQEHLHQPQLKDDRLTYTSGYAFSIEEAPSWWLCFDTLQMIDRELQHVDALLADSGRERFAARGVMGVEDPK